MKEFQILAVLVIVGLIHLQSCSPPKHPEETLIADTSRLDSAVVDITPEFVAPSPHPYLNSFAKLISGNPDSFPGIQMDSSRIAGYQRKMTKQMEKLNKKRLLPLKAWYSNILHSRGRNDSLLAFYPFSGGDFLHLYNVYPNATDYVMMAIEPVGSIPNLKNSKKEFVYEYLQSVEFNLRDVLKLSFFITLNMQQDIKENPNIDGLLPSIIWGVGATGHQVLNMLSAKLDSTGQILTAEVDSSAENALKDGVQIVFYDEQSQKVKTVTYLSCDISDRGISKNQPLKLFLNSIRPNNAFVKAASYLMHYSSFTEIKKCLLTRSENLLQDDTGIPFKYFQLDNNEVQLYGKYVMPVSVFSPNLYQQDLAVKFRDTCFYQGPLPYSMGYHSGSNQQIQMVVMKTTPTETILQDEPLLAASSQNPSVTLGATEKNEPTALKNRKPSKKEGTAKKEKLTPKPKAVKSKPETLEAGSPLTNNMKEDKDDESIIYRVQIHVSSKALNTDSHVFKNMTVKRYQESGLYKFTVGEFGDYEQADNLVDEMRQGFKGAFVVAFRKGKRISKTELRKLMSAELNSSTGLLNLAAC